MRDVLVVGFGAWRLARLLTREEGPFLIFERLRALCGVPTVGHPQRPEVPLLTGILSCPWCCSVWAAAGLWLLRRTPAAGILGAAGLAAALVAWETRDD